ncbi:MAG: hypothetical protein KAI17_04455 [Thiotrichaceae bacterium]|nr:hypothetical protein [Thiotrichaceae bacterium]
MSEYQEIFDELVELLVGADVSDTTDITYLIKQFFWDRYSQHYVAGANNKEFLFDVTVMSCDPLLAYKNENDEYKIYLAVESELGGESASSAKYVERNTIEDFMKLIFSIADRKVMIAAYSIDSGDNEENALASRIQKLKSINDKSKNETGILVIFIKGDHSIGNSRQVKIVTPMTICGYILKNNENTSILNNS